MLCGVQVYLSRVGTLRWFLESARVGFVLMLERGSPSGTFHLSLIYAIVNAYDDLNYVGQLVRSVAPSDLILHMVLEASVEGVCQSSLIPFDS
jgi:hypothetical protein